LKVIKAIIISRPGCCYQRCVERVGLNADEGSSCNRAGRKAARWRHWLPYGRSRGSNSRLSVHFVSLTRDQVRRARFPGSPFGNFCATGRSLCRAARWQYWLPYGRSSDSNSRLSVHFVSLTHDQVQRPHFPGSPFSDFCATGRSLCSAARWQHWLPYGRSRGCNNRWSVHFVSLTHDQVRRARFPDSSFSDFCTTGRSLCRAARWQRWLPYGRSRGCNSRLSVHFVGLTHDQVRRPRFPGSPFGDFCATGRSLCSDAHWRHWLPYGRSRGCNSRLSVHFVGPAHIQVWRARFPGSTFSGFCTTGSSLCSAARWQYWLPYGRSRCSNSRLSVHLVGLLRDWQKLVQRCSLVALASLQKEQGLQQQVGRAFCWSYAWPSPGSSLSRLVLQWLLRD